jgi:hypothetical protein
VSFWLEYDRGTEPRHRVLSKLDGYVRLHRATGLTHVVLIWFDTPGRETSLHQRLAAHPAVAADELAVAIGHGQHHPAGPVWLPAGHATRLRLAELPTPRPQHRRAA